jgi:hypothetical protein
LNPDGWSRSQRKNIMKTWTMIRSCQSIDWNVQGNFTLQLTISMAKTRGVIFS